jgi:hypothetical protein
MRCKAVKLPFGSMLQIEVIPFLTYRKIKNRFRMTSQLAAVVCIRLPWG